MPEKPIVRSRQIVAKTGVFRIEAMDLRFANGAHRRYERILGSARGAVLVVASPDPQTVLLIREYAAGMERYELGFPKGHIESGESVLTAANRELQEELGLAARQLQHVASMTIAPGYLYHTTHVVLARDLYPSRLPADEPEPLEVVPWRLDELEALLARDDFTEARSIAAIYRLRPLITEPV